MEEENRMVTISLTIAEAETILEALDDVRFGDHPEKKYNAKVVIDKIETALGYR